MIISFHDDKSSLNRTQQHFGDLFRFSATHFHVKRASSLSLSTQEDDNDDDEVFVSDINLTIMD